MISFNEFLSRRDAEVYNEIFDTYSKPRLGGYGERYVNIYGYPLNKPNYFVASLTVSGEAGLRSAQDFEKADIQLPNNRYGMDTHTVNTLTNFVNHLGRDFIIEANMRFDSSKFGVPPDDNAFYIDISKLKEKITAISREHKAGPLQDSQKMFEKYLQTIASKLNMTIENNGTMLVKRPAILD
jgi:hypothetical protein